MTDWHTELPSQAALAASSTSGALARHIRRMRRVYAQRHEVVMRFLSGELAPWLTVIQCSTGLHVSALSRELDAAQLRDGRPAGAARRRGRRAAVLLRGRPQPRAGLVIGYGMADTAQISTGLQLLAGALREA